MAASTGFYGAVNIEIDIENTLTDVFHFIQIYATKYMYIVRALIKK